MSMFRCLDTAIRGKKSTINLQNNYCNQNVHIISNNVTFILCIRTTNDFYNKKKAFNQIIFIFNNLIYLKDQQTCTKIMSIVIIICFNKILNYSTFPSPDCAFSLTCIYTILSLKIHMHNLQ